MFEDEIKISMPADEAHSKDHDAPQPSKRGRKRKNSTDAPVKAAESTATPQPRKRGRPSRKKDMDAINAIKPNVSEDQVDRSAGYTRNNFMSEARSNAARRAEYNEQKEQRFSKIARLNDLKRSHTICTGMLVGVVPYEMGICGIAIFEGIKVIIPFQDMYVDNVLQVAPDESAEKIALRQQQILRSTIMSNIEFVIKEYAENPNDHEDVTAIGSRKEAMLALQSRFYEGHGEKPPVVHDDGIYPGTIVGIGQWGLRVCVHGVDAQIWARDMTFRPVSDLGEYYSNGQTVDVHVIEVAKNEKSGHFEIKKAECKSPELEQYKKNIVNLTEGAIMLATVTRLDVPKDTATQVPRAAVFIDGVKVPGYAQRIKTDNMKEPIRQGSKVLFLVTGVLEDKPIATGTIIRIL